MAKLGQLYLDEGVWRGERVLSSEWIERSAEAMHTFDELWRYGYGYAWRLDAFDSRSINSIAGHGLGAQRIYVIPEANSVVVLTGSSFWIPAVTRAELIMENYVIPALQ
jgi:CubicO group peptidase (beta-lactamase class C family)